ncbi:MAG: DUF3877 family protein [Blautia sp.]|nr:DUF3877 family protein [Blautia sp.]
MKFDLLEKNIIDVLEEEQIKLGYIEETVRLYYPLQSLNRFLKTDCNSKEMASLLEEFVSAKKDHFGEIQISEKNDRFCFLIPPKGAAYVHEHAGKNVFLHALVEAVSVHGTGIDDIFKIFRRFSDLVHIEKAADEDYDYLVYFEDGVPDGFYYCLTDEGGHIIYHRYTKEDYNDLFGPV